MDPKNEFLFTFLTRCPELGTSRKVGPSKERSVSGVKIPGFPWGFPRHIHPGRLTWNLKMMVWKMMFLFNWVVFRFHVNLPGCIWVLIDVTETENSNIKSGVYLYVIKSSHCSRHLELAKKKTSLV